MARIDLNRSIANTRDMLEQLREILAQPRLVAEHADLVRRKLPGIARGVPYILRKDKQRIQSIGTLLERNAQVHADRPALVCEDRRYTHWELDQEANRWADFYRRRGIVKGDAVAILFENRPEILFAVAGAAKLGAIAAVINTRQRRNVLAHSFGLCRAKLFVIGTELLDAFLEIRDQLEGAGPDRVFGFRDDPSDALPGTIGDGDAAVAEASTRRPPELDTVRLGDPVFYIYTSGTTGLPKASVMSHFRWVKASAAFGMIALGSRPTDVIYVSLPLYHNNALTVTWSSAVAGGSCMAISRKFSVSGFWDDIRRYQANSFCYIGELCRYLMNQPARPDDADNPVTKIIGNGLRPDIWKQFKTRFGIDEVYEFYGASEGNVVFVNALNVDCTVGMCPAPYAIVEYDVDTDQPVRDADGHLVEVPRGGVGLLVCEVSDKYSFDGYTNPAESERKLFRNAFTKGDVWFNSGDLLKDLGFRHAQFVDRIGDTFRWKSENVSTNEVAEVMNGFGQISETTVYGVAIPDADGKAGMAALVSEVDPARFDFTGLLDHLRTELPGYAWPRFLRFRAALEVTATLKQKKVGLKKQGWDLDQVGGDPIYVLRSEKEGYRPLTRELAAEIAAGKVRF